MWGSLKRAYPRLCPLIIHVTLCAKAVTSIISS
jgi:hypothetical protein